MMMRAMKLMTVVCSFVLLASLTAYAKGGPASRVSINVPFEFTVGEKTLPAGEYMFSAVQSKIYIRSADGSKGMFTMVKAKTRPEQRARDMKPKLVFNVYDGRHYLSQVWMSTDQLGRILPRSAAERELASRGDQPKTEEVEMGVAGK